MALRFTLRQLVVFIHVARLGTTVGTATQLAMSQSAVSAALAELESAVGERLFDRNGRRLVLNDVGRRMLPSAIALVEQAETMSRDFESDSITLQIAASSTIGNYVLPAILRQFLAAHPAANLKVIVGNTRDVARQVADFVADIGLIEGSCSDAGVRVEHWMDDEMIVVAPAPGTGLNRREALASAQWLLREPGSGTRAALDDYMHAQRIMPRMVMQMSSNEAIKQAVMAGMGISLLSLHTIGLELRHRLLAVPEVEGMPVMRRWHVVNNLGKTLSPAAEAFRYFILERGEGFLARHFPHELAAAAPTPARGARRRT